MNIALNDDCMAVMARYPDKYFDLAVVDPPYGGGGQIDGGKRFGGRFDRYKQISRTGGEGGGKVRKKIVSWDYAPSQDYFSELFRVSKNQIIWGGNYFLLPPTRCFLVWEKVNIPENFSMAMAEYAWTSFDNNSKIIRLSSAGIAGRFHPTQKPIDLYRWIYRKYAKPGDKILDTHLGSGSSRRAAHDFNLDFVGCEIDKYYFDLQEKAWSEYTSQLNLFNLEETKNDEN